MGNKVNKNIKKEQKRTVISSQSTAESQKLASRTLKKMGKRKEKTEKEKYFKNVEETEES